MNNKNNTLITVGLTIISVIMMILLVFQNHTINNLKNIIEKTDTIIQSDTIFLDKVVRDTVPQPITETIFKCDTLWRVEGDSVVGEPQIITLVKKKSATN